MQPESLIGKQLKNGWTIEDRRILSHHATGGRHSLGYIAKHPDGRQAFIKLLDPTLNRELDPIEALDDLRLRIEVFQYEQKLKPNKPLKYLNGHTSVSERARTLIFGDFLAN